MQSLRRLCSINIPLFTTGEVVGRNWVPCRNAGHSKWHNIRHTKEAKDMERSKMLMKFNSKIQIAVRAGGGNVDPKQNSALSNVIQEVKDAKLPLASIQKMLETAKKSKSEAQNEVWSLKGPGSSTILVEVFTENRTKTKNDLNTVLRKNKGVWQDSAISLFDCTGIIRCSNFNGKQPSDDLLEESTTHAIEAGANDVTIEDHPDHGKILEFTTAPTSLPKIKSILSNKGYTCISSEIVYIPSKRVELDDDDLKSAGVLCDKILQHPEVIGMFDNIL